MAAEKNLSIVIRAKDRAAGVFRKMRGKLDKLKRALGPAIRLFAKLGVVIGGAIAAIALLTKKVADQGDKWHKLSQSAGVTIETLSSLQLTAEQGGADIDMLGKGLGILNKRAYKAANGTKSFAEAFKNLGVNVRDADGNLKKSRQLFIETANGIANMENKTKRAALAQELFGNSMGQKLLPVLNQGGDAIQKQIDRSEELGLVWSQDAANDAAEFNDAVTELKFAFKGLTEEMVKGNLPANTRFVKQLTEMVSKSDEFVAHGSDKLRPLFSNMSGDIETASNNILSFRDNLVKVTKVNMQPILDQLTKVKNAAADVWAQLKSAVPEEIKKGGANYLEGVKSYLTVDKQAQKEEFQKNLDAFTKPGYLKMPEIKPPKTATTQTATGGGGGGGEDDTGGGGGGGVSELQKRREKYVREFEAMQREYNRVAEMGLSKEEALSREFHRRFKEIQESQYSDEQKEKMLDLLGKWHEEKTDRIAEEQKKEYQRRQEIIRDNRLREMQELRREQQEKIRIQREGMRATELLLHQHGNVKNAMQVKEGRNLLQNLAKHNKAAFEINKAFAISDAIVNTYKGVSKSLSEYPMPIAAMFAAMHLAYGMLQVQKIKQQQYGGVGGGGGGGGGVGGGGRPGANKPEPRKQRQEDRKRTRVKVDFSGLSDEDIVTDAPQFARRIVTNLNEAYRDDVEMEFVN